MKEVFTLKKVIVLILAGIVVITSIFAACSKNDDAETSVEGLQDNAAEVEFSQVNVTDEDGNEVTDENGDVVTTMVMVSQQGGSNNGSDKGSNKDSNKENDDKENSDTNDKKGNADNNNNNSGNGNNGTTNKDDNLTLATNSTESVTVTTKKGVSTTANESNLEENNQSDVPPLTETGDEVNFSEKDQLIVKSMLEVPYLYQASYENADGVPIGIATHVAVWMAEHEGSTSKVYPSSPVVLNLFKYFGQTVVNFKSKCNDYAEDANAPIKYNSKDDTFTISEFTPKKQTVNITKIEDLGENNYYRVTASVSGCDKEKVVAIIQKNKLDTSLGFSIKALKWS